MGLVKMLKNNQVYTCETSVPDIHPEITAEKIFYEPDSMNLTEMELVKSAVSDAGPTIGRAWKFVIHAVVCGFLR